MKEIAFIYRDPLFGIAILIAIIAIVALADYSRNKYRSKKRLQSLKNLIKSYEYTSLDDGVKEFIEHAHNPIPTLMFLAQTYAKSGDSQQAIKIYLSILEKNLEIKDKIPVLESLGILYFEAGFLQRAKNIFIELLKLYPRNINALSYLMRTYESMGQYKKALEVLDCVNELEYGTIDEDFDNIINNKNYLYLMMIINDDFLSLMQKQNRILTLAKQAPSLNKLILNYFKTYDRKVFWEHIMSISKIENFIDLLWGFEQKDIPFELLSQFQNILDIYRAKGYINDNKECLIFELEILRVLLQHSHIKTDLDFEYRCHNCKSIFPFDSHRCPTCANLGIMDLILKPRKIKEK